jgi:hypothetical protein
LQHLQWKELEKEDGDDRMWRGELEEHLNIMGIRNRQALVKAHNRILVLEKNMLIPS